MHGPGHFLKTTASIVSQFNDWKKNESCEKITMQIFAAQLRMKTVDDFTLKNSKKLKVSANFQQLHKESRFSSVIIPNLMKMQFLAMKTEMP